jgi:uncharacterized protein (TIGR03792 family)
MGGFNTVDFRVNCPNLSWFQGMGLKGTLKKMGCLRRDQQDPLLQLNWVQSKAMPGVIFRGAIKRAWFYCQLFKCKLFKYKLFKCKWFKGKWLQWRLLQGQLLQGQLLQEQFIQGQWLQGQLLQGQLLQGRLLQGQWLEGILRKSIWLQRWPKSCLALALLVAVLVISAVPGRAEAAPPPALVVEQLRLKVPSDAVPTWLEAERGSWEPWLAQQPGFLRRQLFWDPQRQEGTLMIYWASRQQWQATSSEEQQQVQQRFELLARAGTGQEQGNPFPLIFSGELLPQ